MKYYAQIFNDERGKKMEQTEKTKYYGIYILRIISDYWVTNDRGDEIYVGETKPTEQQINYYADLWSK